MVSIARSVIPRYNYPKNQGFPALRVIVIPYASGKPTKPTTRF